MNEKYQLLSYWDSILSRPVIAAATHRTIESVAQWNYTGVPRDASLLLMLYSGELSMADWEDQVEETAKVLRDRSRKKKAAKAKEANDRLEAMCGKK